MLHDTLIAVGVLLSLVCGAFFVKCNVHTDSTDINIETRECDDSINYPLTSGEYYYD